MSRIAGLITVLPESRASRVLSGMLEHFDTQGVKIERGSKKNCLLAGCSPENTQRTMAESGPHTVAIDGKIFSADGLDIRGMTAADVVLNLFERYGFENTLSRINGDFAVALYDSSDNTLWIGRDRVGVRPMYYTQGANFFAFASQPGALLRIEGISRNINRRFVGRFAGSHYRTFDNVQDESPFEAVQQLPAAHIAVIRFGQKPTIKPYWSLTEGPDTTIPERELAEYYRELLLSSVKIRLEKSSAPAFLLSGGMDSSSVIAAAVAILGGKQHAFSSVYEDTTYDESEDISSILDSSVEEWHPVKIKDFDLFATIDKMVRAHDEPVATATWLSHLLVCEEIKKAGFNSIFGGLGGDELNAGEYEHFFYYFADLQSAGKLKTLYQEVSQWSRNHDHPEYRKNMLVVQETLSRVVDIRNPGLCLPDRDRIDRYADTINSDYFDVRGYVPIMDICFSSYLKNRTYQDIFRETAPCCLRAEDRHSKRLGLDHMDPFFDYRLIEFMFLVPGSMKIRNGVTKILLRESMKGLLPEVTRTRVKKTGWNAPAHVWFSGRALDELESLIVTTSKVNSEFGAIYNMPKVKNILHEHKNYLNGLNAGKNHMMFLWQAANLAIWFRQLTSS